MKEKLKQGLQYIQIGFFMFRDLSWKKKLLIFVVFAFCVSPILPHDDTAPVESTPAEHIINGANDFKIPAPYSEDNYQFKENNNGVVFTVMDSVNGSMLTIEKLEDGEFEELKDSPEFTERYDGATEDSYYSHEVSQDSNIYKIVSVSKVLDYYDEDIYFVEVVKVDGNYYKISVGNPEVSSPYSKLDEWRNYLLEFNKVNNLTLVKIK